MCAPSFAAILLRPIGADSARFRPPSGIAEPLYTARSPAAAAAAAAAAGFGFGFGFADTLSTVPPSVGVPSQIGTRMPAPPLAPKLDAGITSFATLPCSGASAAAAPCTGWTGTVGGRGGGEAAFTREGGEGRLTAGGSGRRSITVAPAPALSICHSTALQHESTS